MKLFDAEKLKSHLKLGKDKKEVAILIVLVIVLALVLYIFLFFKPALTSLTELLPKVYNKNAELKTALMDITNREVIKKKRDSLVLKVDEYEKMLPGKKEIPKFLESLSEVAAESGVKILSIKPIKLTDKEREQSAIYQEVPIQISAKCGYHQLGKFLEHLETGPRLMKVSDIEIEGGTKAVTEHNVKLMITTYTLKKGK